MGSIKRGGASPYNVKMPKSPVILWLPKITQSRSLFLCAARQVLQSLQTSQSLVLSADQVVL